MRTILLGGAASCPGQGHPRSNLTFPRAQLGLSPDALIGYVIRAETRREDLGGLRAIYGYRVLSGPRRAGSVIERLTAAVLPEADDLVLDLYRRLPEVRITDLLLEVHAATASPTPSPIFGRVRPALTGSDC